MSMAVPSAARTLEPFVDFSHCSLPGYSLRTQAAVLDPLGLGGLGFLLGLLNLPITTIL
jgi:hypothetical protein